MAAKRTSELIPMCHPLLLSHVDVQTKVTARGVLITSTVTITGPTGVEMEALTAASVAALTVYDMTKALDKGIEIQDVYLLSKTGGKSGDYARGAGTLPAAASQASHRSGLRARSRQGARPTRR